MVGLLKAVGGLLIAGAILAAVGMLFIGYVDGLLAVLPNAVSAAFGGVMIIAFGSMLEHLEAISRHSATQNELLTELLRKTPTADSSHKTSAPSLDQLAKSDFRADPGETGSTAHRPAASGSRAGPAAAPI